MNGPDDPGDPEDAPFGVADHGAAPALLPRDLPVDQDLLDLLFGVQPERPDPIPGLERPDRNRRLDRGRIEDRDPLAPGHFLQVSTRDFSPMLQHKDRRRRPMVLSD